MAILTIKVDDELLQKYREQDQKVPVQKLLEAQLKRFADIPVHSRAVILSDEQRSTLEALYGKAIEDTGRFVEWVRNLLSVNALETKIPLKEGQRKKLIADAKFWKQPYEKYVEMKLRLWIDRELGGY